MKKFSLIVILSIFLASCASAVTPVDLPVQAEIKAPLIELPALIKIFFLNERDGWGVTETQIVRTNDGGITWYNVTPPDMTETGYSVDTFIFDNDHVWVQKADFERYPNGGPLYRTTDGGITWTSIDVPFSSGHIKFVDAKSGWVLADLGVGAGSNAVVVYQTSDGGETWVMKSINDPNHPDASDSLPLGGLKFGITPLNMQTAWIFGVVYAPGTPYVYRTDDGGASWAQISLPLPPGGENAELAMEQLGIMSPDNTFLIMHVTGETFDLAVFTSTDAGKTWSLTPTLIPGSGSADFLSAEEMVVYNGNQFYVTRDAARTWSIIPPDVLFGESFAGMDFVNTSTGWVVTQDPANHRSLYRTSDGGATWIPVIP